MAHIGEELRLVLACDLKLPALVLDFIEQPHVLDCAPRLVGEGLDKPDLLSGEWPDAPSHQGEYTDSRTLTHQRDVERGAITTYLLAFDEGVFWVLQNVVDVNGLAFEHGAAGAGAAPGRNRIALQKFLEIPGIAVRPEIIEDRPSPPG